MNKQYTANAPILEVKGLSLRTPEGRPLIRQLNMVLNQDKVALIGRNGVGKTTLLKVLTGNLDPHLGQVKTILPTYLVAQHLQTEAETSRTLLRNISKLGLSTRQIQDELALAHLPKFDRLLEAKAYSKGELRKLYLLYAKLSRPAILLLDEPTADLDQAGIAWLCEWLARWDKTLLVTTHHQGLLAQFAHFFHIAESGCQYFSGSLSELHDWLEQQHTRTEMQYVRNLQNLLKEEEHFARVRRRRRRKKNFGRISELNRCPSRAKLNEKRSHAQVSQGRLSRIRRNKISFVRAWTKASRRALAVKLPLELFVPQLKNDSKTILSVVELGVKRGGRQLFQNLSFEQGRDRLAIVGPNGAGKTTLLQILFDQQHYDTGEIRLRSSHIGSIEQGARNWLIDESLLSILFRQSAVTEDEVIQNLLAHGFPLALANRPLLTLSPGERLRAALICLFQKEPAPELLVLDEPTDSLDYHAQSALCKALKAWPGGLMVSSHDRDFLNSVGFTRCLSLDGKGGHGWSLL